MLIAFAEGEAAAAATAAAGAAGTAGAEAAGPMALITSLLPMVLLIAVF